MFKKKREKLKVDTTKLTPEQQKESGYSFRNGLFIFCLILLVVIIVLAIVIANLGK